MKKRMSAQEKAFAIESPFADIATQMTNDDDLRLLISHFKNSTSFIWECMIPKVTYDEWMICYYTVDEKFYRINFDDEDNEIYEVVATNYFSYDEDFRAHDKKGRIIDPDDLADYYDCLCCGEADDMSCFLYFDTPEEHQ